MRPGFIKLGFNGRPLKGEGTQVHLYGLLTRYLSERMPAGR